MEENKSTASLKMTFCSFEGNGTAIAHGGGMKMDFYGTSFKNNGIAIVQIEPSEIGKIEAAIQNQPAEKRPAFLGMLKEYTSGVASAATIEILKRLAGL